jgi:hypothetical protein
MRSRACILPAKATAAAHTGKRWMRPLSVTDVAIPTHHSIKIATNEVQSIATVLSKVRTELSR